MSENTKLRSGFTTGVYATATASAALLSLLEQSEQKHISVTLPKGKIVRINIAECSYSDNKGFCSAIKDGGDDPDVTHGIVICAEVKLVNKKTVQFTQGKGVGRVTLPGLEIPVGEPAINPVPRHMISQHLQIILDQHSINQGVEVCISVPEGEKVAQRTFNPRLGIVGGISILGTTGIVKPYSSEAFIASIEKGVRLAAANGCRELVFNSGGRSEKYLKAHFPQLPDFAFVQYGNWVGECLALAEKSAINKVTIGIMLGKAAKLAEGLLDTHSRVAVFNSDFLQSVAQECGYHTSVIQQIGNLKLARNITELIPFSKEEPLYKSIALNCKNVCSKAYSSVEIDVLLVGQEGEVLDWNK